MFLLDEETVDGRCKKDKERPSGNIWTQIGMNYNNHSHVMKGSGMDTELILSSMDQRYFFII